LAGFAAPAGLPARAAGAFLAEVLAAERFTGSSVAGRAFVAATYTLSILQIPMGAVVRHRKASAMSNIWRLISPLSGMRPPSTIVTTV
jgi:hypothetical protein